MEREREGNDLRTGSKEVSKEGEMKGVVVVVKGERRKERRNRAERRRKQ